MRPVIINKTQLNQPVLLVIVAAVIFVMTLVPVMLFSQSHVLIFLLLVMTLLWQYKHLVVDDYDQINIADSGVYLQKVNLKGQQHQPIQLSVIAYWHMPWLLFVKFKKHNSSQVLYLGFFRYRVGAANYSRLVARFTQQKQQEIVS